MGNPVPFFKLIRTKFGRVKRGKGCGSCRMGRQGLGQVDAKTPQMKAVHQIRVYLSHTGWWVNTAP